MSRFLKRLLERLLMDCSEQKLGEIFSNVVQSPKLKVFADGLHIFLHHVMKKVGDSDSAKRIINERIDFLDAIWGADRNL